MKRPTINKLKNFIMNYVEDVKNNDLLMPCLMSLTLFSALAAYVAYPCSPQMYGGEHMALLWTFRILGSPWIFAILYGIYYLIKHFIAQVKRAWDKADY